MNAMEKFTGRTMRWFRQQIGISRGSLASEMSLSAHKVQNFEMGLVKNSLVSPAFAARYGISIEAIAAWRRQKGRKGKPVAQAMEMLERWERQTMEIIHAENA